MWEIGTPLGPIEVPDQPGLSIGRVIRLAVRPEWADLFAPDSVPPGENALPGTVEAVVYQGEMMRVRVALADRTSLVVALRNEGQLTRPLRWQRGDQVAVGWRPEDSQLLEER